MALELRTRLFELLATHVDEKFSARQIATLICRKYPNEARAKLENSSSLRSEAELVEQLVSEIGAARPYWETKYPQLRTTEGRPKLYYWVDTCRRVDK